MSTWVRPDPYPRDDEGFVLPPVCEGWRPYIVAVCGGTCLTATDWRFVRNTVRRLLAAKVKTHNVSFHLAPSPGAAELVLDMCGGGHEMRGSVVSRGRDLWGRAAEFRSAWALMDCAHGLVAFEPLDLIARYALHWAATVPDRNGVEGRGIDVRVVKWPEVLRQPGRG